ncbi:alpha/beta fold hydrolase [Metabacillus halosaccharovorans]|uniref:alpha/beta fold hydrolase n=1 Tax=Metabacillus halosaccharovorans TaxID=930124 RepID=UPI001C1FB65D|nr:alpha/beta hydrolase [Metabacillus halosaccharovorans]MBU7592379.1 alpha/beta hydrolase [Metabacillus halosaccharovorans]
MVFLHGGGVSSWMWDKQIQYFKHYHCVTIDLPEQGKSNDIEDFSIKNSAKRIIDLIGKIGRGKEIIVIGFSLGAQVAVQMLSMNPNLITFAIINSALVRPVSIVKKMINPVVKLTFPLMKIKSFSKFQAKSLFVDEEYFDTYYKESSNMKSDTLIRILEENMSFTLAEEFYKVKSKILVTVGEKERSIMIKSAKDIVSANPNCVGILIPNVGHGISFINPNFFNQIIETWIQNDQLPNEVIRIN